MSEILNLDVSDSAYRYNHGRGGRSWNEMSYHNPSNTTYSPDSTATGRSQLFGDNHVEWRVIDLHQNLPIMSRYLDEWDGPGSGWLGRADVDYYREIAHTHAHRSNIHIKNSRGLYRINQHRPRIGANHSSFRCPAKAGKRDE